MVVISSPFLLSAMCEDQGAKTKTPWGLYSKIFPSSVGKGSCNVMLLQTLGLAAD